MDKKLIWFLGGLTASAVICWVYTVVAQKLTVVDLVIDDESKRNGAESAEIIVYKEDMSASLSIIYPMTKNADGSWTANLDLSGVQIGSYVFRVTINSNIVPEVKDFLIPLPGGIGLMYPDGSNYKAGAIKLGWH